MTKSSMKAKTKTELLKILQQTLNKDLNQKFSYFTVRNTLEQVLSEKEEAAQVTFNSKEQKEVEDTGFSVINLFLDTIGTKPAHLVNVPEVYTESCKFLIGYKNIVFYINFEFSYCQTYGYDAKLIIALDKINEIPRASDSYKKIEKKIPKKIRKWLDDKYFDEITLFVMTPTYNMSKYIMIPVEQSIREKVLSKVFKIKLHFPNIRRLEGFPSQITINSTRSYNNYMVSLNLVANPHSISDQLLGILISTDLGGFKVQEKLTKLTTLLTHHSEEFYNKPLDQFYPKLPQLLDELQISSVQKALNNMKYLETENRVTMLIQELNKASIPSSSSYYSYPQVYFVFSRQEKKNIRTALIINVRNYAVANLVRVTPESDLRPYYLFHSKEDLYNLLDDCVMFTHDDYTIRFSHEAFKKYRDEIIAFKHLFLYNIDKEETIRILSESPQHVLDEEEVVNLLNQLFVSLTKACQEKIIQSKHRAAIKNNLKKLFDKDTLKLNETTLTKDSISYGGLTIKILNNQDLDFNFVSTVLSTIQNRLNTYLETNQFEQLRDLVLKFICDRSDKIPIQLKYGKKILTIAQRNNFLFINDIRINKNEAVTVLNQSTCYESVADFEEFLKQVSRCSLEVHEYLSRGLFISIYDSSHSLDTYLHLKIRRKKNRNYLVLQKDGTRCEFLIKNTPKFFSKLDMKKNKRISLADLVNFLLFSQPPVVEGLTLEDVTLLIKDGIAEWKNAIKRSNELLATVKEKYNLSYGQTDNGEIQGLIVKGKKYTYVIQCPEEITLKDYLSDKSMGAVYRKDGSYVCIIDKTTNQVGADKIINRIFALKNDSVLATQITTL